jgi:hypothetical protein
MPRNQIQNQQADIQGGTVEPLNVNLKLLDASFHVPDPTT